MRRFLSLITILALTLTLALCPLGSAEDTEVAVIDHASYQVILEAPAERIVSCYYISTASLIALGLEENLVGIEMKADTRGLYKLAAPSLLELPAVGSGKGVNIEEIAALEPDVVILPIRLEEDARQLELLGIPVVMVDPESRENFEDCVEMLGTLTGRDAEAEALLARYAEITDFVTLAVAYDSYLPTVYMAAGSDYLTTYPAGLYQHDLIATAGGYNVASELEGDDKVTIDAEQLLSWDPEYIFIVADADYTADDILSDARLATLKAVQQGNVYAFPSAIEPWDYPTPSSVLGELFMASRLHPNWVSEETFVELAAEFYRDVFGVEVTAEDLGL